VAPFVHLSVQCFSSGEPQSVFPAISYNIPQFKGTPQQLEELFVAARVGKPGVEKLLSGMNLSGLPTMLADSSDRLFFGCGFVCFIYILSTKETTVLFLLFEFEAACTSSS